MPKSLLLLALTVPLALAAAGLRADDDDQDAAREALKRGEIKPLEEVLAAARGQVAGEVVKVELDRDDGRWIYEIKILTPAGERREVELDASSLKILEVD